MMHSMLAVIPEGLPLGVLGMKTWTRGAEERGKGEFRRRRTIREKESAKWLEGVEHLNALKGLIVLPVHYLAVAGGRRLPNKGLPFPGCRATMTYASR
jgi:hypothetical protein